MWEIQTRLAAAIERLGIATADLTVVEMCWAGAALEENEIARKGQQIQFTAICSSRLGRDSERRRAVSRRLSRLMLDHRGKRDRVLMVAVGSAIDAWATRAAQIFRVPLLRVRFLDKSIRETSAKDQVLVHAASRLEALYVRRRGAISRAIEERLATGVDVQAKTHVHVTGLQDCAAARLIQLGAVGRWLAPKREPAHQLVSATRRVNVDMDGADGWFDQADQWLVHCTRARGTRRTGRSADRWMDQHLVASDQPDLDDSPLGVLRSILAGQRLIASAITSSHDHPVVCFSAVPLPEILSRRTYRAHLGRWDYEPFGIAIRRDVAESAGARPVVYGSKQDREQLSCDQRFRFQSSGTSVDWTAEREYRFASSVDLTLFDPRDVRVFVEMPSDRQAIGSVCPWAITVVSDILAVTEKTLPHETET